MARIRSIKPEFFTNERLSALSAPVHLLAAALLTYADDHGYFNANPGLVKAGCGPLREDFANIPEMLAKLRGIGYVEFYDGTDGRQYGHIVEFSTHQRVDHPKDSKIKPLLASRANVATPREIVAPDQGTGNREQGREGKEDSAPSSASTAPAVSRVEHPELELSAVFVRLPLKGGAYFEIREGAVTEWGKLYPSVDVKQSLRAMLGWLDANPRERKTRAGVKRFVNGWLSREQKGASSAPRNGHAESAWAEVRGAVQSGRKPQAWTDPVTPKALERMGGFAPLLEMRTADAPFRQRDFVAAYHAVGAA